MKSMTAFGLPFFNMLLFNYITITISDVLPEINVKDLSFHASFEKYVLPQQYHLAQHKTTCANYFYLFIFAMKNDNIYNEAVGHANCSVAA